MREDERSARSGKRTAVHGDFSACRRRTVRPRDVSPCRAAAGVVVSGSPVARPLSRRPASEYPGGAAKRGRHLTGAPACTATRTTGRKATNTPAGHRAVGRCGGGPSSSRRSPPWCRSWRSGTSRIRRRSSSVARATGRAQLIRSHPRRNPAHSLRRPPSEYRKGDGSPEDEQRRGPHRPGRLVQRKSRIVRHQAWGDGSFFPVVNHSARALVEDGATVVWEVEAACWVVAVTRSHAWRGGEPSRPMDDDPGADTAEQEAEAVAAACRDGRFSSARRVAARGPRLIAVRAPLGAD